MGDFLKMVSMYQVLKIFFNTNNITVKKILYPFTP